MDNLEKRMCGCGKEFGVSKFAPKTTLCPECAITKLADRRKEKKELEKLPPVVPEAKLEEVPEIDSDPFKIIEVYDLFGKEAIYLWLLLRGFKVARSGALFKQYDTVYMIAPLGDGVKFVVSLLNDSDNNVMVESPADVDDLPEPILVDVLPIVSLLWPKSQGGAK